LHVELTLIKLNFLQQAIELSSDNGDLVKKKRLDGPVAFKSRSIPSLQAQPTVAKPTTGPKLYVEETRTTTATPAAVNPAVQSQPTAKTQRSVPPPPAGVKKNLLSALREKYGDQYAIEEVKEAEVLNMQKLTDCWMVYAGILEKQLKHSSAGTFKTAILSIENDIRFTITVFNITSQKFVEQEKMMLTEHIHSAFNNRAITFEVLVEAGETADVPAHLRMNSRQKYDHIVKQYPLVKELKDRLKLEIDY
jgi:DNA polymerase-3 subunit gamma/tau